MREAAPENVYAALLHYPVYDRNHREVATCITNLDVHDMARCAATYGLKRLYLVTPMASQREYVWKLLDHWVQGGGGAYNPHRREALENVRVVAELGDVLTEVHAVWGRAPRTVVTCARGAGGSITHGQLRKIIFEHSDGIPYIIVFGTGWGLTEKVLQQADYKLEPIEGAGDYNHLSVRCAAAITLDRLLGREVASRDTTPPVGGIADTAGAR